tara:strand:- start:442 stop:807 length:366 start_codon:yes stop_codon:yes gene_type:complete
MIYKEINTNLAGHSFECLEKGIWEIGLFKDNSSLKDKDSDFFETVTFDVGKGNNETNETTRKCLKNKVTVRLMDGSTKYAHIIHWNPSNGYFCIDNSKFWDQFTEKTATNLNTVPPRPPIE